MKTMRGGRGLGDSIYLQAIARHLTAPGGDPLTVASDFPDVFEPLGRRVRVIPFTRTGIGILAHYVARKGIAGTTQFQDMCLCAGIRREVELRLEWPLLDTKHVGQAQRAGKPVLCVQLPRAPMGRTDGFGECLLPEGRAIQDAIDAARDRFTIVQIGSGKPLFSLRGIDVNLANETTVHEMLCVAAAAAAFIGYPSFIIPLAESLNRPALILWSRRGLKSSVDFIARITPEKLIHKPSTRAVIDDAAPKEIADAVTAFL